MNTFWKCTIDWWYINQLINFKVVVGLNVIPFVFSTTLLLYQLDTLLLKQKKLLVLEAASFLFFYSDSSSIIGLHPVFKHFQWIVFEYKFDKRWIPLVIVFSTTLLLYQLDTLLLKQKKLLVLEAASFVSIVPYLIHKRINKINGIKDGSPWLEIGYLTSR
jgi:hypothetical protein